MSEKGPSEIYFDVINRLPHSVLYNLPEPGPKYELDMSEAFTTGKITRIPVDPQVVDLTKNGSIEITAELPGTNLKRLNKNERRKLRNQKYNESKL
jgi:hypothetical protein